MTLRQKLLLAAPPLLLLTTLLVFVGLAVTTDVRRAYFWGFAFYWLFWCLAFPLWLLGPARARDLFRASMRGSLTSWGAALAMALPIGLAYGYVFPVALAVSTPVIVALSAVLAVVNAALEELLWRGTFLALFPESRMWGWFYPAVAFGVWHVVPQLLVPSAHPGGSAAFVAVATPLGLAWGWLARRARSIRATAVVHALFDFAELGARAYF